MRGPSDLLPYQAQGRPQAPPALGGPLSQDHPTSPPEALDLGAFFRALRSEHRHLAPGVDDLRAAEALARSARWRGWDDRRRAAAIASLLARDQATWTTIAGDFKRFVEASTRASSSPPAEPLAPPVRATRHRRGAAIIGAVILAAVAAILIAPREPGFEIDEAPPQVDEPRTAPDVVPSFQIAHMNLLEPEVRIRAPATEARLEGPSQRPWPWASLVLATSLGAFGLALLFALRRRILDLGGKATADHQERERLDEEHRKAPRPVHLYDIDKHLPFEAAAIDDAAGLLGRRELADRGRLLDVAATIAATLRRSGWLTPIFERRREPARLLVLVDVEGGAHPLLEAAERVLERWRRTGLEFTRLDYTHDPTRGLYPPGRLNQAADRVHLDELSRSRGGSRLVVLSRLPLLPAIGKPRPPEQDFAWVDALRPWLRRVVLDLYPPSDDPVHEDRVAQCEVRQLPRFPLTAAGLRAAAAHLIGRPIVASIRASIDRERAAPTPSETTWMLWAAAGACVPDASWAQLEDIRRVLLPSALPPGESLPASHDVARMIRWLTREFQFDPIKAGGRALDLSSVEDVLLRALRRHAGGMRLEKRVRERLKDQLRRRLELDDERLSERQRHFIQLKIDFHEAVLDPAAVERLLDSTRVGFDPELAELLRPELARQRDGFGIAAWDSGARRRAEERIEAVRVRDEGAPARVPGPTSGEVALGLGVAIAIVGVSFGLAIVAVLPRSPPPERMLMLPGIWTILDAMVMPAKCPVGGIEDPPIGGILMSGEPVLEFGDGVAPMRFIALTKGEFSMGSPNSEPGHRNDETLHRVCLGSFEIGVTEVTVAQYRAITGDRPSLCAAGCADEMPVQNVTWEEAVRFANSLTDWDNAGRPTENARTPCYDPETWSWNRDCTGYRLPTEAEWEYAARAGTRTSWSFGEDASEICRHGNVMDLTGRARSPSAKDPIAQCDDGYASLAPVGRFLPNAWGIHDMHGNVWEWVYDGYEAGFYGQEGSTVTDPVNPVNDASGNHVTRGGSFYYGPEFIRSAVRVPSTRRNPSIGLRMVRAALVTLVFEVVAPGED